MVESARKKHLRERRLTSALSCSSEEIVFRSKFRRRESLRSSFRLCKRPGRSSLLELQVSTCKTYAIRGHQLLGRYSIPTTRHKAAEFPVVRL